ncbi:MAG TPA: CatA-like O-acetyltransferase [Gemmobacter sp.]|nr:CatA-like O-acetyltransferase [Gemmobacter sp.]
MSATEINLATWPRREALALFRRFQKPQYSVTARIDVTALLARKAQEPGFSSYLACVHAAGAGLHAVPELCCRIRGDRVVQHDRLRLSPTLQFPDGRLGFTYLEWHPAFATFAPPARAEIDATLRRGEMEPGIEGDDAVAFLSCQPWLDFTAFDNPVFDADDTIPRVCWGRYTPEPAGRWTMAVALQVHHGMADGAHVAAFFAAMQAACAEFAP